MQHVFLGAQLHIDPLQTQMGYLIPQILKVHEPQGLKVQMISYPSVGYPLN